MGYAIAFSSQAGRQLKALRTYHRRTLIRRNTVLLAHQPQVPTRNRKPLEPNALAPWELRVGALRVFYFVNEETRQVCIVAIGTKDHARVLIDGEVVRL
ncbi:MAG: type II toxin-antitoxin system RelE/ParE family toxin [Planctomycetes bacterium]|nr:type II toxin-antitoxin system RelE/ParE family toxin [Planctomycetota bacterium]